MNVRFYAPHPASGVSALCLGTAYAGNAVNLARYRGDAVVSWQEEDGRWRAAAYYAPDGEVVLAIVDPEGSVRAERTGLFCPMGDAHNTISLGIDGSGYFHLCFGSHKAPLNYCCSLGPHEPIFVEAPMIGEDEEQATYPQFFTQPNGDVLLLYREGRSGSGRLVLNRYVLEERCWERVCSNLINGGEACSPYWQACVDDAGRLHLSWCWRDTNDASTNHDICYAVSEDAALGRFVRSDGVEYELPISPESAEVAVAVPAGSGLINQTDMCVDAAGRPHIASYWTDGGVTQYRVVSLIDGAWNTCDTGLRSSAFELDGVGTRSLPCARPALGVYGQELYLFLRDDEAGGRIVAASCALDELAGGAAQWKSHLLTRDAVPEAEPLVDRAAFAQDGELAMFIQAAVHHPDAAQGSDESAPACLLVCKPSELPVYCEGPLASGVVPQEPRYAFVVLHYLAGETTVKAVDELLARFESRCFMDVIIVDNGSPDGSGPLLEEHYAAKARVTVLQTGSNLGFAQGNNAGVALAREMSDPDFVIVLNNDLFIEQDDFCEQIAAEFERSGFAVLGPDIVGERSGKHQSPCHADPPSGAELDALIEHYEQASQHFRRFCRAERRKQKEKAADSPAPNPLAGQRQEDVVLHGACLVFSRPFLEAREHAFNPDTFLYAEEEILAFECRRDGLPVVYEPALAVRHLEDVSTQRAHKKESAQMQLKYNQKLRSLRVLKRLEEERGQAARS